MYMYIRFVYFRFSGLSKWKIFSILCHFIMGRLTKEQRLQVLEIHFQKILSRMRTVRTEGNVPVVVFRVDENRDMSAFSAILNYMDLIYS